MRIYPEYKPGIFTGVTVWIEKDLCMSYAKQYSFYMWLLSNPWIQRVLSIAEAGFERRKELIEFRKTKKEHIFLSESSLCSNNILFFNIAQTLWFCVTVHNPLRSVFILYVKWSVDDFTVSGIVADFYIYSVSPFFLTALSQVNSTVDIGEVWLQC